MTDPVTEDTEPYRSRDFFTCGLCGGSGWVPRDPDIGTDQECFVCDGKGEVTD